MEVVVTLGTVSLERLRDFVEWLQKAPFEVHLDFSGEIQKGDVTVKIKAPHVQTKVPA